MSLNQELKTPRVLPNLTPRLIALMVFIAAAVLVVGCKSAPSSEQATAPTGATSDVSTAQPADDMTATEAAIAGLNDTAPTDAPQQTAQLLRPDAPMSYTVKRGDTLWDI